MVIIIVKSIERCKTQLTIHSLLSNSHLICLVYDLRLYEFLNLVEPSIFYALSKSRLNCCTTALRESRAEAADDVYPGTKRNSTSVSSLYLLEKMKTNESFQNILELKLPGFISKSFFFFETGVRVKFRFGRLLNKL